MKGTRFEFRFRIVIFTAIFFLGYWAPWERYLSGGRTFTTWYTLANVGMRSGGMNFLDASVLVAVLASVCALAGAVLRTWGTAYLTSGVVLAKDMQALQVMADGPFRYMRNPLYLGTLLNAAALTILMPPTGAIFTLVAVVVFQLRLIGGEEAHLTEELGTPYLEYLSKVPRLLPRLRARVAASGAQPRWGQAFVGELYMWGAFLSFAVFSWQFNAMPIERALLISFGAWIVVRNLFPANDSHALQHGS